MKKTITLLASLLLIQITTNAQLIDFDTLQVDSVTDIDGNVYKTILFGDTWWMSTNLRTKHYNDGSEILQMDTVMTSAEDNSWSYWGGVSRWAYPGLDPLNFDTYGLLYSWFAVADSKHGGVCPEGWSLTDTADWFNLGRLIVDADNIICDSGTRNTPSGGTETYYEVSYIENVGRFLKTDNGELWNLEPTISSTCGAAGMNIVPSGKLNTSIFAFGSLADYWTGCYVHSDSTGQGRRYLSFENTSHSMSVNWNHNANMQCARCVKSSDTTATRILPSRTSDNLQLYPNPATGTINVNLPGGTDTWLIYNSMGVAVLSGNSNKENSFTININSLPGGLYIFKTGNMQKLFIKQ